MQSAAANYSFRFLFFFAVILPFFISFFMEILVEDSTESVHINCEWLKDQMWRRAMCANRDRGRKKKWMDVTKMNLDQNCVQSKIMDEWMNGFFSLFYAQGILDKIVDGSSVLPFICTKWRISMVDCSRLTIFIFSIDDNRWTEKWQTHEFFSGVLLTSSQLTPCKLQAISFALYTIWSAFDLYPALSFHSTLINTKQLIPQN